MRFGQAITDLLTQYDVDTIFGIPGVHTLELFRDIDETGISTIIPRHEQGAGFMADGYARVTGKPGVCYLITGPGVLNALTPIAQAWHDSIPMLIIASTVRSDQLTAHRGTLHDTPDIAETLRDYTLISENVTTPERFVEIIDEAFTRWGTERPRPVYIGVPLDVLEQEVGPLTRPAQVAQPATSPSSVAVHQAVTQIMNARTPLIIAGGGAQKDGVLVSKFAELIDAPVITTGNAKGILPTAHPLHAGVSLPFLPSQQLVEEADVVVALGTELSDFEYLFTGSAEPSFQHIVRIDIDGSVTHPDQDEPTIPMRVAEFLNIATNGLEAGAKVASRSASGRDRTARARAGLASARATDPYTPWLDAISNVLPPETIVALDSAQVAYQSHHFLDVETPGRWLAPYGYGTLGPALPMAVGAAVAEKDAPVLALAGDGGVLFTIAELATARDLGRQLTLVIWNNSGYKEIEVSFDRVGITPAGVATSSHDIGIIATGFGATTHSVRSPAELSSVLASSFNDDRLSVIIIDAPDHLQINAS